MEIFISFLLGALASWIFSHYYYKRSRRDAEIDRVAHRLDWADKHYKTFLVAAFEYGGYVPLYALINWSGQMKSGIEASGSSTGCVMYKALLSGDKRVVTTARINSASPKDIKFQLTEKGIECAKYLKENEIDSARFDIIDTAGAEVLFNQYGFPPK